MVQFPGCSPNDNLPNIWKVLHMVDSAPKLTFSQTLAPLPPLYSICLYSNMRYSGKFLWEAYSQDLGLKGKNDPSVFHREPQCPWEHLTQRSCPPHFGHGGNHSTSLEFQLRSDGTGTLPCNWPQTPLSPTQVGRWKGVCNHSVSMCFGMQGSSIKPKWQKHSIEK